MADKHIYDEHGNYKGRVSDTPPTDPAVFILIAIGIVVLLILLLVLAPGLLFNLVMGRFKNDSDNPYQSDFFDASIHDPLTWIISVATWSCLFLFIYFVAKIPAASPPPSPSPDKTRAEESAKPKEILNEFRVSNRFVKTLGIWCCRIVGPLGCLGAIGVGMDAINGNAKPDDPGIGGSIVLFLICSGITVFGFWRRKNKIEKAKTNDK